MIVVFYGSNKVYANSFQIVVLVGFFLISPFLRFYREVLAVQENIEAEEFTGFLKKYLFLLNFLIEFIFFLKKKQ